MSSPSPDADSAEPRRRDETRRLTALLCALLMLLLVQVVAHRWSGRRLELRRPPEREYDFRVDLNRATELELSLLPGIGPALARRIAADRSAQGPFRRVDELSRVRGVGPRLIEQLRPRLTILEAGQGSAGETQKVTTPP